MRSTAGERLAQDLFEVSKGFEPGRWAPGRGFGFRVEAADFEMTTRCGTASVVGLGMGS